MFVLFRHFSTRQSNITIFTSFGSPCTNPHTHFYKERISISGVSYNKTLIAFLNLVTNSQHSKRLKLIWKIWFILTIPVMFSGLNYGPFSNYHLVVNMGHSTERGKMTNCIFIVTLFFSLLFSVWQLHKVRNNLQKQIWKNKVHISVL